MKALLSFLLFLCFLTKSVHGKRSFDIVLEAFNCTSNPKIVSHINCSLIQARGFFTIQLIQEAKILTYSLKIEIIRSNNERIPLLDLKNGDGCVFLEGKHAINIVNIYRDILAEAGELPKCPIAKDRHLEFKNLRIDPEKFPTYMPEASFAVWCKVYAGKDFFFAFQARGSITQKRKMNKNG